MYSTYSTRNRNRRRYESSEDALVYSEMEASTNMARTAVKVASKIGRSPQSVTSRYWYMKYNRIMPFKVEDKEVNTVDVSNESPSKITLNIKGVEITMVFKQDV